MAVAGSLTYDTKIDSTGFKSGLNRMNTGAVALGNVIANVFNKVASVISGSIDGAVKRFDTLNNFPKVMTNLGISAEDSTSAVNELSDKLTGIPTTLDSATLAVQRFTSKNNDVKKSTKIFLAVNDAILAGGASTEIQASALEQLSQSYSKGKMDMMEWRTLQTAMPAQLKQVATAMGLSVDELGEMMRSGENTDKVMNQFIDTIIALDKEGLKGFPSLSEQARNATGGIGTSVTNMKTRITSGMADIVKAIDDGLKQINFPSISDIINNIGKEFKSSLDWIANEILPTFFETISGKISISDGVSKIGNKLIDMFLNGVDKLIKSAPKFINKLFEFINSIGELLTSRGPEIINKLCYFELTLIKGLMQQIPNLIPMLVDMILMLANCLIDNMSSMTGVGEAMISSITIGIFKALPSLITKLPILIMKLEFQLIKLVYISIPIVGISIVKGIINGLFAFWPIMISKVKKFFRGTIFEPLVNQVAKIFIIGLNIVKGIWKGISSGFTWIKDKIKGWVGNILKFFKKLLKINSPSKLFSKEVGQWIPKGIAVGIEANTDSVLNSLDIMKDDMLNDLQGAVNLTTSGLNADASVKANYSYKNDIIINANLSADVEMDKQKVGQILTPVVTKTLKTAGVR